MSRALHPNHIREYIVDNWSEERGFGEIGVCAAKTLLIISPGSGALKSRKACFWLDK